MKKIFYSIMILVVIAVYAGYNIYLSQNNLKLSDLALANVEALANNELPDVEITCNQFKNTGSGRCWVHWGDCSVSWGIHYDDCRFSGYQYNNCLTPCD